MRKFFTTQSQNDFICFLLNQIDIQKIENCLIIGNTKNTKSLQITSNFIIEDFFYITYLGNLDGKEKTYNHFPIYLYKNYFYYLKNNIQSEDFLRIISFFKQFLKENEKIEINTHNYTYHTIENVMRNPPEFLEVYANTSLREFVLEVFKKLYKKFGDAFLLEQISERKTQINGELFKTIIIPNYFNSTRFFGVFDSKPDFQKLKTEKGTFRFYNENLKILNQSFIYLTNQWENKDTNSTNPKFSDFSKFVTDFSKNKYIAIFENSLFKLIDTLFYSPQNRIFFGCPGTGKSYKIDEIINQTPRNQYERVTFHPEYSYIDFVGGFKPISEKDEQGKDIIKYQFVPQTFINIYINAWKNPTKQYYLIIEEINRGNCASIFGDIFQLLDRQANYAISPSQELKQYLTTTTQLGENHGGVINGLQLPPNLDLLATMNTSDQSLFPMDSAFKRRWEWEYVPINYTDAETQTIEIDDKKYSWASFLKIINQKIYDITESEDKQMGNRFINEANKMITPETLKNKVMFYLWFDVFKNENPKSQHYIFKKSDKDYFKYMDLFDGNTGIDTLKAFLVYNQIPEKTENIN